MIERHERYLPIDAPQPDIGDVIRMEREAYADYLERSFKRVSYIILQAALMCPGSEESIAFNRHLTIEIKCDTPKNSILELDPQWKQYTVNGEWVGNMWGMQAHITDLCFQQYQHSADLLGLPR
jgi:hypothetical protein